MAYVLIFLVEALTSLVLALLFDVGYMILTGIETVSMGYALINAGVICLLMQTIKIIKFIIRKSKEE